MSLIQKFKLKSDAEDDFKCIILFREFFVSIIFKFSEFRINIKNKRGRKFQKSPLNVKKILNKRMLKLSIENVEILTRHVSRYIAICKLIKIEMQRDNFRD